MIKVEHLVEFKWNYIIKNWTYGIEWKLYNFFMLLCRYIIWIKLLSNSHKFLSCNFNNLIKTKKFKEKKTQQVFFVNFIYFLYASYLLFFNRDSTNFPWRKHIEMFIQMLSIKFLWKQSAFWVLKWKKFITNVCYYRKKLN